MRICILHLDVIIEHFYLNCGHYTVLLAAVDGDVTKNRRVGLVLTSPRKLLVCAS